MVLANPTNITLAHQLLFTCAHDQNEARHISNTSFCSNVHVIKRRFISYLCAKRAHWFMGPHTLCKQLPSLQ